MPPPAPVVNRVGLLGDSSAVWIILLLMSGAMNVLTLSGAVYMLQVYDRVLTSHSVETLVVLSALVVGLYLVLAALDAIRQQMLLRVGGRIDACLMPIAQRALVEPAPGSQLSADAVRPIRDVDTMRSFYYGPGPAALLDLPWGPIFLFFVWALSPLLGLVTLTGILVLLGLAALSELAARKHEHSIDAGFTARLQEIDAAGRNRESIAAMGLGPETRRRFLAANQSYLDLHRRLGDIAALIAGASRLTRLMLQAAIVGVGAWIAIRGDLSVGAIMAASIAAARALAPFEQAIAGWRGLVAARRSHVRLRQLAASLPPPAKQLILPRPVRNLSADRIAVVAPGSRQIVLGNISLVVQAGSGLAIVGRSGAGKSALARALAGVWPLAHGTVSMDGAPLQRWSPEQRGRLVGYMPQQIELFPATIAENIARLEQEPDAARVIEAATSAGMHESILSLPHGYETLIGSDGSPLSAGQRQQIGLARALYGDPFLLVLDEPNASLDTEGEEALRTAILAAKQRGAVVVVALHRRSLLSALDYVAVLEAGQVRSIEPRATFVAAHLTHINRVNSSDKRRTSARETVKSEGASP